MKWKLPPKREDEASGLVGELAELLASDVDAMAAHTGQKKAQCLATMLRPLINMQLPNTGKSAVYDRRQKEWNVQCTFGAVNGGAHDHDEDGEFAAETVRGFDHVIDVIRECVDDFHEPTGNVWHDFNEFNDRSMKQRFGGLYSNIAKGGGEASTRIFYEVAGETMRFVDVAVERAKLGADQKLDADMTNKDSAPSAVSRLRAMREARGQS
jgi:hypothetical protein